MNLHQQIDSKQQLLPVGHLSFRLFHYISIVVTALVLQFGFLQEAFAVDATTTAADVTSTVDVSATTVAVPSIRFLLNEDNSVTIEVTGVDLDSEVSGFTFNGNDITQLIQQMIEAGVMQKQSDSITKVFALRFSTENPRTLEDGLFGVVLTNGSTISKLIQLEDSSQTKGAYNIDLKGDFNQALNQVGQAFSVAGKYVFSSTGISSVSGTLRKIVSKTCGKLFCTTKVEVISKKPLTLWIRGTLKNQTIESWVKVQDGNTDSFGFYSFGAIKSGGKAYCGPIKLIVNSYYDIQFTPSFCTNWWSGISLSRDIQ